MEDSSACLVTVLAQDLPVQPSILSGHGRAGHLTVNVSPDPGHVLHGQSTGRTGIQTLLHHANKAFHVKEMRAGRDVSLQPAGMYVLQADRAVVVGGV